MCKGACIKRMCAVRNYSTNTIMKKKKTTREGEKVKDMEFQRYGRKQVDFPEVN